MSYKKLDGLRGYSIPKQLSPTILWARRGHPVIMDDTNVCFVSSLRKNSRERAAYLNNARQGGIDFL
jgi:hypothetical protein